MPSPLALSALLDALAGHFGSPPAPAVTKPFEQLLWESVAYLADDQRRAAAFEALRRRVGTTPQAILAAPTRVLQGIVAGILPTQRAGRLRDVAEIAVREFGGDLEAVLRRPLAEARRALMRFPGIGPPGAEKILLVAGAHPVLALDSNGLRVLLRVGYGRESKSYAASYRSAQEAVASQIPRDTRWLTRAHLLLRHHGQELCRRTRPACPVCPLRSGCAYGRSAVGGTGRTGTARRRPRSSKRRARSGRTDRSGRSEGPGPAGATGTAAGR